MNRPYFIVSIYGLKKKKRHPFTTTPITVSDRHTSVNCHHQRHHGSWNLLEATQYGLAFKTVHEIVANSDLHGVLNESWSGAFSGKAFRMEAVAVIAMVHLFSNGDMADLTHERYRLWQEHRAYGRQKHPRPSKCMFQLTLNKKVLSRQLLVW